MNNLFESLDRVLLLLWLIIRMMHLFFFFFSGSLDPNVTISHQMEGNIGATKYQIQILNHGYIIERVQKSKKLK